MISGMATADRNSDWKPQQRMISAIGGKSCGIFRISVAWKPQPSLKLASSRLELLQGPESLSNWAGSRDSLLHARISARIAVGLPPQQRETFSIMVTSSVSPGIWKAPGA